MSYLLTKASLEQSPWLLEKVLRHASEDAEFLRLSYPQFDSWFAKKVIPGIRDGERTLLLERRGAVTVGLLIVKHTAFEKKLCTLRVRPDFECKGLGVRLFQTAFHLLETEQPLLSVSELAAPKFERLFRYFGFAQEAVYQGRYLPNVDEYSYNGLLESGCKFHNHRAANSEDCALLSIHGRRQLAYEPMKEGSSSPIRWPFTEWNRHLSGQARRWPNGVAWPIAAIK